MVFQDQEIFFYIPSNTLDDYLPNLTKEIKSLTATVNNQNRYIKRNKDKIDEIDPLYKVDTEEKEHRKNLLMKYKETIDDYFRSIKYEPKREEQVKKGSGIMYFSPQDQLKRLELLGGSLAGVPKGALDKISALHTEFELAGKNYIR